MKTKTTLFVVGLCAVAGWCSAAAADIRLNAQTNVVWGVDDPRDDLRPGLRISARVRFDADPAEAGEQAILTRGFIWAPPVILCRSNTSMRPVLEGQG